MNKNEEINNAIFDNYPDLRNKLIKKYNLYLDVKANETGMLHPDIDKNFIEMMHSYISSYIINRTSNIPIDDIFIHVQDRFNLVNIQTIISEDGDV